MAVLGESSATRKRPIASKLLVIHGNTFQTTAIDAGTGKLTALGAQVTITGQEIGGIAFATF